MSTCRVAAGRHVSPAYKEAWADGPPYAVALELERARAEFAGLGLPEPPLPPFDPARMRPVPYGAEISAFIAELVRKPKQHGLSAMNLPSAKDQADVPSASAEPDRPPREHDQRHPDTIDQTRLAAFIAPPESQGAERAERDPAVFDESRVGAFIAKWDAEHETPPAEERGEEPTGMSAGDSSAEGDLGAPIAPAARAGRRTWWETLWKRERK